MQEEINNTFNEIDAHHEVDCKNKKLKNSLRKLCCAKSKLKEKIKKK